MSIADLSLVRKQPLTLLRHSQGYLGEDGRWVEGTETEVVIQANVHPFSDYQVMILPESDRTRSWMWVFTVSPIRSKKEGPEGYDGDRFYWDGDLYEVMKTQKYSMGVRDHFEAKATRVELTPN